MVTKHTKLARARLEWANRGIEDFASACGVFIESNSQAVSTKDETEGERTNKVTRVHGFTEPPIELRFMFGDCVHNIRATCDNLIQGIAREAKIRERVKMPVCVAELGRATQGTFDHWECNNGKIAASIRKVLRDIQPFNAYRYGNIDFVGKKHPLRVIHDLWNDDKHESPLEIVPIVGSHEATGIPMFMLGPEDDLMAIASRLVKENRGVTLKFGGKVEEGAEVARTNDGEGNAKVKTTFKVALRKERPGGGWGAVEILRAAHGFVCNEVIAGIERA